MLVRLLQFRNADFPMLVTPSCITTSFTYDAYFDLFEHQPLIPSFDLIVSFPLPSSVQPVPEATVTGIVTTAFSPSPPAPSIVNGTVTVMLSSPSGSACFTTICMSPVSTPEIPASSSTLAASRVNFSPISSRFSLVTFPSSAALMASSNAFFTASAFSEDSSGLAITLSTVIVSDTVSDPSPPVIVTVALMLPASSFVASVFVKSVTLTVMPSLSMPALSSASCTAFSMAPRRLSSVVSLDNVMSSSAASAASFATATFSSGVLSVTI